MRAHASQPESGTPDREPDPLVKGYQAHLKRTKVDLSPVTQRRFFQRNYLPLLAGLPEGPVLDVGCGLGEFLLSARELLPHPCQGLDLVAENVRTCREHGLEVVQADAFDYLAGAETRYAAIVMNYLLEHIPRDKTIFLLQRANRALLAGGRLVVAVPNMANPLTGLRGRYGDLTHEVGFTELSLCQALEAGGFEQCTVHPVDIYVLDNPLLNVGARLAFALQQRLWRLSYRLQGVLDTSVLTKNLLAVGTRLS